MQQAAQVKPLSLRRCMWPCRGHGMPCWPPAPALRASAHWFGTSCMAYSARRTLQRIVRCMRVRCGCLFASIIPIIEFRQNRSNPQVDKIINKSTSFCCASFIMKIKLLGWRNQEMQQLKYVNPNHESTSFCCASFIMKIQLLGWRNQEMQQLQSAGTSEVVPRQESRWKPSR
jgi:hypothetical protein